jgi:hypothetical protein
MKHRPRGTMRIEKAREEMQGLTIVTCLGTGNIVCKPDD